MLLPRYACAAGVRKPLQCLAAKGSNRSAAKAQPTHGKADFKVCPVCNRPFHWRKKWAAVSGGQAPPVKPPAGDILKPTLGSVLLRCACVPARQVWGEVKYCSERCRRRRGSSQGADTGGGGDELP